MSKSLFTDVVLKIDTLMQQFSHTKKDLGYGIRWTFENQMWFDLIDYEKNSQVIFRVGRGAWLVKQYPMLVGWFQEVKKVVAKSEVYAIDRIKDKHLLGVLELLDQAPKGVGAIP